MIFSTNFVTLSRKNGIVVAALVAQLVLFGCAENSKPGQRAAAPGALEDTSADAEAAEDDEPVEELEDLDSTDETADEETEAERTGRRTEITVAGAEVKEGKTANVRISIPEQLAENLVISWVLQPVSEDGTTDTDFDALEGEITIMAGEKVSSISISAISDELDEGEDERHLLILTTPDDKFKGKALIIVGDGVVIPDLPKTIEIY